MLGRAIDARAGPGLDTGHAGHVENDAPAVLQHLSEARPSAEEGPAQIGVEYAVKCSRTRVDKAPAAADAGVVHQDVEPPTLTDRLGEETFNLRLIRYIRRDRDGFAAVHLNLRDRPLAETLPPGGHDDTCAFSPERQRDGFANAAAASRDNGDLFG